MKGSSMEYKDFDLQREKAVQIKSKIKAITFDLWGTLVDESGHLSHKPPFKQQRQNYLRMKLAEHGHIFSRDNVTSAYTATRDYFEERWRKAQSFDAELGVKYMLQQLKTELPQDVLDDTILFFEEVVNQMTLPLFPGTADALAECSKKYRLGIISDTAWISGEVLRGQLNRHNVLRHFDALLFSNEVGVCKPHENIFQRALDELQVKPEECLHIGDLQFTDIKGAKNMGMYAAWIYRPEYLDNAAADYGPDLIVNNVAHLGELLGD